MSSGAGDLAAGRAEIDASATHVPRIPQDGATTLRHVAIVTSGYPGRGGVETVVANLCSAFEQAGIPASVASILPGPGALRDSTTTLIFDSRHELQTGSVLHHPRRQISNLFRIPKLIVKKYDEWRGLRRLAGFIAHLPADTLVIATSPRVGRYLHAARVFQKPRSWYFAVQYHLPFTAQQSLEGQNLKLSRSVSADVFVALSDVDAGLFEAAVGVRCATIPNPTPATELLGSLNPEDEARYGTEQLLKVVSVSRLSGEKQLDQMMECFVNAVDAADVDNAELRIYGSGPEEARLREKLDQFGTRRACIRLMGWVDDVRAALDGAALLLSTSRFEAFAMNILEAGAAGVPALAYECGPGTGDLVRQLGGVLIPPGDVDSYTEALRELLTHPQQLALLAARARRGSARFAPLRIVEEWEGLYRSLIQEGSAAVGTEGDGQ